MQRRSVILGGSVAAVALVAAAVAVHRAGVLDSVLRNDPTLTEEQWSSLKTYCTDCHSVAEAAGDVVFEGVAAAAIPAKPEIFETVVRKLRGGLMPPPGNPRPKQAEIEAFIASAERAIDEHGRAAVAGHVPVQRLNRAEYAATVKDLLDVEIDAKQYLPSEIEVDGFDNIAAALSVSPAFLEQYIGVARKVARLAVGEAAPKLQSVYFPPPMDDAQDSYIDGMPLGTRGGTRFAHTFPTDGEYRFTITDLDVGLYPRALESEQTLVMLVDRKEVFRAKLGGRADLALVDHGGAPARAEIMQRFASIPVSVTAGVHEVIVTFVERTRASTEEPIEGFTPYGGFSFTGQMRVPRLIGGIEVKGPFEPTGVSRTASRAKLFVCEPETPAAEQACAERITEHLARRAFRRPVAREEVARLLPFYEAGRARGGFDLGVEQMVTAVLASPDFLYRAIAPPPGSSGVEAFALDDLELASRLSFFLWSQGPDDALLELAAAGKLSDPQTLETQARRMLADPRANALVVNFALKWLNVDELESVVPDDRLFPEFSDELRVDFATEISLFLRSILLEDRNVRELLSSDATFLNERLARHYGITSVRGPQFRRVTLENPVRFGLLGKAAVLLRTSYGDRTSPVLRGAWVLEKLMDTPPTPPPPGVETNLSTPEGEKPKTIRARLEQHRADQSCNGCHGVIDPYGLALENFTVTGQWREFDALADAPIDASTALPGGTTVAGPEQLREALLAREDQFVQAFVHKLMMYAVGRELEYHDMPQVRAVVRAAAEHDYTLSAIVAGIVTSDAFRRQAPGPDPTVATAQAAR
jgi:hypothetical protein